MSQTMTLMPIWIIQQARCSSVHGFSAPLDRCRRAWASHVEGCERSQFTDVWERYPPKGRCEVMRKGGISRNTATIEPNQGLELEKGRNARRSNPQRRIRPALSNGSCIRVVDAEF